MLNKLLVAVAATCGGLVSTAALALTPYSCEPATMSVTSGSPAQFVINCKVDAKEVLAPNVQFSGSLPTIGTAPYPVKATYVINSQSTHGAAVASPFSDQKMTGELSGSTVSIAALPAQFGSYLKWDEASGVLSVQESAKKWHAYSIQPLDLSGNTMVDAGVTSVPVSNGQASINKVLGKEFSRFAGSQAELPVVNAILGLRDGKLEVLLGETRVAAQDALRNAVLKLDQRPKDMARAWNLGAIAQFLGLEDERRYAEAKVAAHNPNHLAEFSENLTRIPASTTVSPAN